MSNHSLTDLQAEAEMDLLLSLCTGMNSSRVSPGHDDIFVKLASNLQQVVRHQIEFPLQIREYLVHLSMITLQIAQRRFDTAQDAQRRLTNTVSSPGLLTSSATAPVPFTTDLLFSALLLPGVTVACLPKLGRLTRPPGF